jgi:hypothetical protein
MLARYVKTHPHSSPEEELAVRRLVWDRFLKCLEDLGPDIPSPRSLGFEGRGGWETEAVFETVAREVFNHAVLSRLEGPDSLMAVCADDEESLDSLVTSGILDFARERLFRAHFTRLLFDPQSCETGDVLRVSEILGKWLVDSLKARGLHGQPPARLGYENHSSWRDPECLREAALDCYVFAVFQRRAGLGAAAQSGRTVAPMVRVNVKWFVTDRMRKKDPVGYKAYFVTKRAVKLLREAGHLADGAHTDGTMLRFGQGRPGALPASQGELEKFLLNHPKWPEFCQSFVATWVASGEKLFAVLTDMPAGSIHAFMKGNLITEVRGALCDFLKRFKKGPFPRRPPVGDDGIGLRGTFWSSFWNSFDQRCVNSKLERVPNTKTRNTLRKILEHLQDLDPREGDFVQAEMAIALGISPQNLNYHMRSLREILDECSF